jgi:hypothetical protein
VTGSTDEVFDDYFTEAERERLNRWRVICAQRPELTREQIESAGALLQEMSRCRRGRERGAEAK